MTDTRYPLKTRIRLLVVEDSEEDFLLLSATLGRQGLNVECHRVEEAETMIEALAREPWDAVISDHQLPRFSSIEALRTLRDSGKVLPFLIVSGTIDDDVAVEAMRNGADDFLNKSRLARLGPALTNALRAAETRRERIAAELALRVSEQKLRELSAHLQTVVEEERRAIAREIHDEIGGMLTALRFDLSWVERNGSAPVAQRATQALETLGLAQHASQNIVRSLRPPVLDAGIVPAIEWQLAQFRKRSGLVTRFRTNTDQIELTDEAAMTVYRTLQEALTNVVKHSGAHTVAVDMVVSEAMLSLEIHDDGHGIGATDLEKQHSFGLRGLAERARSAGGWLEVSLGRGGAALLLTVPVTASRQESSQ
ncbi:MAG TPA: response regulator [Burkholderiaceae bacterium]|nr:response regulator [Burkholderiaceae bacterium]